MTYAGPYNGYGRMIQMDHGNGITTRYGHLSGFAVAGGQTVRRGQVIGYVGLSGRSTGPHLPYRRTHPRHAGKSPQIPAQHDHQAGRNPAG